MDSTIKRYSNSRELATALAEEFALTVRQAELQDVECFVALAGGNTPRLFYETLTVEPFVSMINWSRVHLFWGDERCVPPEDEQSNYRMAREALIDRISIPAGNVHRIRGEAEPQREARRYEAEVRQYVPAGRGSLPQLDWIFLGMGEDGHTASLFPESALLAQVGTVCAVADHPQTGQKRITMTLPVINNARRIAFLVTGDAKRPLVEKIAAGRPEVIAFPAARVVPHDGVVEWYIEDPSAGR